LDVVFLQHPSSELLMKLSIRHPFTAPIAGCCPRHSFQSTKCADLDSDT
jgi:hypothetical protein